MNGERSPTSPNVATSSIVLGLPAREWSIVAVALAIAALPAVMPVMVGALTHQFGIRVDQAG